MSRFKCVLSAWLRRMTANQQECDLPDDKGGQSGCAPDEGEISMLRIATFFLAAALSAALFGFSGLGFAEIVVELAQIFFLLFFAIFLISLMAGIAQQSRRSEEFHDNN